MERPGKLICVGLNYAEHAAEAGFDLPTRPIIFSKWTSSMIDSGAPIRIPSFAKQVDWEAELAVVIDRGVSNISEDDALDFVRGYACMNDVTARDIQMQESQWVRSKSFDTFGPFGPRVVPRGEIADPQNLGIRCLVNGEVMQDGSTSDMVFSVASLISHLSQGITLGAGDIIATGTPAGIGLAKQPQRFLTAGDEVTVEIDGVGSISNPVVGPE